MFGINVGNRSFGSAKEMRRALEEKDEQLAAYEALFSELARLKEDGKGYFAGLTADRAELDQGLTRVVDFVHEGGELANTGNTDAAALERDLRDLSAALVSASEEKRALREAYSETTKELTDVVENNKHFTAPAKDLQSGAKKLQEDVAAVKVLSDEVAEFFRNMTVTALTAAIDAGRLGESAARFVQTAEDIRIESEKNEKKMQELLAKVQELTARTDAFDEIVDKVNVMQKDANLANYNALTHHEERERTLTSAMLPDADEVRALSERAGALKKMQEKIFAKQSAILDEMEILGQNFMDERKTSDEAEEEFLSILDTISFSASRQNHVDVEDSVSQSEALAAEGRTVEVE